MKVEKTKLDTVAVNLAKQTIRWRWWVIAASIIAVAAAGFGGQFLTISSNYRAFFSDANPELMAFENFQSTYTKNDNFLFVIQPPSGDTFAPEVADAVETLTELAWSIPFTIRVDSISNFQHTWASEDDLVVEDLIIDGRELGQTELDEKRAIALAEPLLKNQLISPDADTTGINVVLQYPEEDFTEVPMAAAKAREVRAQLQRAYPDLKIAISGLSMLNNGFAESGMKDMTSLVPLMYATLLLMMLVTLRSVSGTFAALLVIAFSTVVAMGVGGFFRVGLTPVSMTAPTIILTLAIADSVHILISLRGALRQGLDKAAAIVEAIRVNFLAISITSVTTIVGFLSLNFSDSPPFWHLGNLTAVGIGAAWILSVVFLPAVMSILPLRTHSANAGNGRGAGIMEGIANFVINRYKSVLVATVALAAGLIAMVPNIELNDEWTKYFDDRLEFRRDTDFALENLAGLYPIEFSLTAADTGGISEPDFLNHVERFSQWLRGQDDVTHVYSITDIMKRLNKNMHGDDPAYYTLPADRELSAQYLLLYELSLPYGLDLNDRINIDKSATRVTATLGDVSTIRTREFIAQAEQWLVDNTPKHMQTTPTGATVMFSYIAERNIQSMLRGNLIAVIVIAAIMMIALRSFSLGTLSLVPNALPILMTFGIWALLVGRVGMAAATVTATSLGIIVDNTVHLLTKYQRGRQENHYDVADAIRYAFRTVGIAVVVNALILSFGFAVLATSTFRINSEMGLLTALAVLVALVVDLLLVPALLMLFARRSAQKTADKRLVGDSPLSSTTS